MHRRTALIALPHLLAACAGVPLMAVPRLIRLQSRLLDLDPGELMVAIQLDARLAPPVSAVPSLQIAIRPAEPGAFEAVERSLPMRLERVSTNDLGLRAPSAQRHWLLYSLPPASQAELRQIQSTLRRIRAEREGRSGGSLSLGISQEGMAPDDAAWAASRWETWLRASRTEGFWEVWSGSVGELLAQARSASARR